MNEKNDEELAEQAKQAEQAEEAQVDQPGQEEQVEPPVYAMICVVKGVNETGVYETGRPLYKPEDLEKWFEENPGKYNVFIQLEDPDAVKSLIKIIKFEGTPFIVAVQK